MLELIFHVGTPKTGSSALQVFFARNHAVLRAAGIDYFRIGDFSLGIAGNISSGNGSLISRSLLPPGNPIGITEAQPHIKALLDAIDASDCKRGLISSEIFADAEPAALESLIEQIKRKGITPKAFFYVRRQDQFLSSAYIQQVKRHQCVEYPEVYVRKIYRQVKYLRYHNFFGSMVAVFGAGNVMVRVYEKALSNRSGLFTAFLSALDVEDAGFDLDVSDINTSLSTKNLLMMLLLNKYRPRMNFSDFVVENEIISGAMRSGVQHQLFSDTLRAEIDAYFADENAALAKEYFSRPDLFDPMEKTGHVHSISRLSLSTEDAVGFLGGILVRLDGRVAAMEAQLKSLKNGQS
jgi:hypothetical protein